MQKMTLSKKEIGSLCLELSLLLRAGVCMGDGLYLLAEDTKPAGLKELLQEMARQCDEGRTASEVFRDAGCFPDYLCRLLWVGECTGRMEESLAALAQYYEEQNRLNQRIKMSLVYPVVLGVVMLLVILVLLIKVLPVFGDIYLQLGSGLTGIAGGMLYLGQGLGHALPVLCVLLGLVLLFLLVVWRSPNFRGKLLRAWTVRSGGRGVFHQISLARFAQSLSLCMRSGVSLEEALDMSAAMLEESSASKAACVRCMDLLEKGASFAEAMGNSGLLPQSECRLLDIGVRSGAGDSAMEEVSRRLSEQSELALETRVGQIEPALVVATSLMVGIILLSVMLPLVHIMAAIG